MKPRVVIVGMGEMGRAMRSLVGRSRHVVQCWDICPGKVQGQKSLFEIVPHAQFLFLCVPSWCLPGALKQVRPFVHRDTVAVTISKGLQQARGETSYEFLTRELHAGQPIAYIGGAMLAEELESGQPGFGVIAGKSAHVRTSVRNLFKGTRFSLEESSDVRGVSLASVLKNIYALGLGITQGLNWGGNARAWFAAQAIDELDRVVLLLNGKRQSSRGRAGLVDLLATGFSPLSKNVEVGGMLVRRKKILPPSEGLVSIQPLMALMPKSALGDFPLMRAIGATVSGKEAAHDAFSKLLKYH